MQLHRLLLGSVDFGLGRLTNLKAFLHGSHILLRKGDLFFQQLNLTLPRRRNCRRLRHSHARQILPAQRRECLLVGKILENALVLRGGFVRFVLHPITFAQPENRRGRQLPVFVELRRQRRIIRNRRVQIAIRLLLQQPLLQQRRKVVRLRARQVRRRQNQNRQNQTAECCFHKFLNSNCQIPPARIVMVL